MRSPSGCFYTALLLASLVSSSLTASGAAQTAVKPAAAAEAAAVSARPDDIFQPCPFPNFDQAVQRFSKVISFQTVSSAASEHHVVDEDEFKALDAYLAQAYAQVGVGLQVHSQQRDDKQVDMAAETHVGS